MSFFFIGILELDSKARSSKAFDYLKELSKLALTHNYSMQMQYTFQDPFYRSTLDPIYQSYYKESSNLIEFEISDSPLANSFDSRLWEVNYSTQGATSFEAMRNTSLFTFLSELWLKPFIKSGIFTFSYGPAEFEILNTKVLSFNDMLTDFSNCIYNTSLRDPRECYIVKK